MSAEEPVSPENPAEESFEGEEGLIKTDLVVDDGDELGSGSGSKASKSAVQIITRFMCKFCGMQFIRRPDMDAHASLHDDEKPPLTCGVCGKVYNTRSKLQRHVRVHSGERPFPCVVCGKRFPRSDHVKQHMRVHAKLPGDLGAGVSPSPAPLGLTHHSSNKSYCRLCGVKFEHKSELNKHLLSHGFNKLFSCIYCGEVFESNEQLKAHKLSHEPQFEEYLPVLSVPDPGGVSGLGIGTKASGSLSKNGTRKKRPGRPKGATNKRRKDMPRITFAKFKLARRSGSETWQAIGPVLKKEQTSPDPALTAVEKSMPILERILKEKDASFVKSEEEEATEAAEKEDSDSGGKSSNSDFPPMAISACYSLAEGQDNSDIPDIDEIRASTLTDGSNMIVVPMSTEGLEDGESNADEMPIAEESCEVEEMAEVSCSFDSTHTSQGSTTVCTVAGSRTSMDGDARFSQTSFIRPLLPSPATAAAATLMTLQQQQVSPQVASVASISTEPDSSNSDTFITAATTAAVTTRPTISLLPNVLAFRTHPILATPTLNLTPTAVHPSGAAANLYGSASNLYNPLGQLGLQQRGVGGGGGVAGSLQCPLERFSLGVGGGKMMRCQYCCIWFEDAALGLLHQSLHSADESDPFTCKKCLKRLGNRLEFTAHIIWHLDPTMEDSAPAV